MATLHADRILALAAGMFLCIPALRGADMQPPAVDKVLGPWVFCGYRNMVRHPRYTVFPDPGVAAQVWRDSVAAHGDYELPDPDSPETPEADPFALAAAETGAAGTDGPYRDIPPRESLWVAFGSPVPGWLRNSIDAFRIQEDFMYSVMVSDPSYIEYAYWDLPVPPRLPEEDYSFTGWVKRLNLPEAEVPDGMKVVTAAVGKTDWLHTLNVALQLSQAYLSDNWYQGGNSYLAFVGNFLWDVQLNPVYHPKWLLQSTVSYKLSLNTTPEDKYHDYSVSQDLFQYNFKAGLKARDHWYYTFTAQFKTQFLNSYPANSMTRSAAFLSPGELNLGLGMTYSKENAAKTVKFSASVSPISYNLKTCINRKVDGTQFGIDPGRRWHNEIGSSGEVNFHALMWGNVSYTTRLFVFSDYSLIQGDWEQTLNFQFSKVFSTQVYAHMRYDSSTDPHLSRRWGKLQLKEILSVGINYTFSTK